MADDLVSALASMKEEEALKLAREMLDSGQDPVHILELCRKVWTSSASDLSRASILSAGKGGGFILSSGSVIDTAQPENVRAMIEFTKEYGIYG